MITITKSSPLFAAFNEYGTMVDGSEWGSEDGAIAAASKILNQTEAEMYLHGISIGQLSVTYVKGSKVTAPT